MGQRHKHADVIIAWAEGKALIAAMLCLVAATLGDEVDVPDELV